MTEPTTIADFNAKKPNGEMVDLSEKLGKVLLVVNTASKCGFTPQYDGLEKLWQDYGDKGFEVLAFPCNQFGGQEPGTADEIESFCKVNFGLSFPLMAKIEVNGDNADPLPSDPFLKDTPERVQKILHSSSRQGGTRKPIEVMKRKRPHTHMANHVTEKQAIFWVANCHPRIA
ncbi:MAG: hypothetical protein B7X78_09135 [Sphingomonadales bacterium 39-62-4]|nr:MAG: hypothetical protein B7X78_09135 [Sphingomonadales bacterium 39-62-4]